MKDEKKTKKIQLYLALWIAKHGVRRRLMRRRELSLRLSVFDGTSVVYVYCIPQRGTYQMLLVLDLQKSGSHFQSSIEEGMQKT